MLEIFYDHGLVELLEEHIEKTGLDRGHDCINLLFVDEDVVLLV